MFVCFTRTINHQTKGKKMTTIEKLEGMNYEAIENAIWGTVLDFYSSVSDKSRIMDMMHAHEDFTNAINVAAFGRDDQEIRECANVIIEIYADAL